MSCSSYAETTRGVAYAAASQLRRASTGERMPDGQVVICLASGTAIGEHGAMG